LKESLTSLVELQSIDSELEKLEAIKGDLPEQVNKLKRELQETETRHDTVKSDLEDVQKTKRQLESDLHEFADKSKKYQEQLYRVTSNREYDAITTEIDTIKTRINEVELQVIELLEKEETLNTELKSVESELTSLRENLETKEESLVKKIQETEKDVETFSKKREQVAARVNPQVLYQYERIRKGIGNTAVVAVQKYSCGGCFSAIPPQKVVEIRMMNQLILCESCGRILVSGQMQGAVVA